MYEGVRVRLRAFRPEDAEICEKWLNDLDTMRLMGGGAQRPRTVEESWTWANQPGQSRFAVETREGRLIGMCTAKEFDEQSRSCMVGWLIGEKGARGQGYGTDMIRTLLGYTFGERRMERVALTVYAYNERAIRLYEKLGFEREGVLRAKEYTMGRYWDVYCYAMLKREYEVLYGAKQKIYLP